MLQVYILEDDEQQRQNYQRLIESYIFIEGLDMQVDLATCSPEALLAKVSTQPDLRGLFFLDIELVNSDLDGLQVAERIRNQLNFAEIVFVTTHSEMAFLTFERKVEPLDYVLKDKGHDEVSKNIRDDIRVAYHRYTNHVFTSEQHFSYQIGSRVYEVPMSKLIYIATVTGQPGKIEVHYENGMVEYPYNLNQLEVKYPKLFRCHKSFLINLDQVQQYDDKTRIVIMRDGSQCEVSYRKEHGMRQALLNNSQ